MLLFVLVCYCPMAVIILNGFFGQIMALDRTYMNT
mgnify:CR=1 FL=1